MRQFYAKQYGRQGGFGSVNGDQMFGHNDVRKHLSGFLGELFVAVAEGSHLVLAPRRPLYGLRWWALSADRRLPGCDLKVLGHTIDVHSTWEFPGVWRERGSGQKLSMPDLILQEDDAPEVEHVFVGIEHSFAVRMYGTTLGIEDDLYREEFYARARTKKFCRENHTPRCIPHEILRPYPVQDGWEDRLEQIDTDLELLVREHLVELGYDPDAFYAALAPALAVLDDPGEHALSNFAWACSRLHEGLVQQEKTAS